jgi:heat shock protein HslJ
MSGQAGMRVALLALVAAIGMKPAMAQPRDPYSEPDRVWILQSLGGTPFEAEATLVFVEPGRIAGQAPCNRYGGALTADWPGFGVQGVFATRMACPDLAAEGAFLAALSAMTQAALDGDGRLVLSNETGGQMEFRKAD